MQCQPSTTGNERQNLEGIRTKVKRQREWKEMKGEERGEDGRGEERSYIGSLVERFG